MGAACLPYAGISPQCANAVLSTAGLALSSELQASAAGASALGRGGDGAGPELMQCQREPGTADAAPLSAQDHDKQNKRWGGPGGLSRTLRCPCLCSCPELGDASCAPPAMHNCSSPPP